MGISNLSIFLISWEILKYENNYNNHLYIQINSIKYSVGLSINPLGFNTLQIDPNINFGQDNLPGRKRGRCTSTQTTLVCVLEAGLQLFH